MQNSTSKRRFPWVIASLILVLAALNLKAALPGEALLINPFNSAGEATAYFHAYGDAYSTNLFSTNDATGNTGSGSILLAERYGTGHPQGAIQFNLANSISNAFNITNLQFDIKIDADSAVDRYGSAAYFQLAIRDQGDNYVRLYGNNVGIVTTNNGWQHISVTLPNLAPLIPSTTAIKAIIFDPYDGNYTNAPSDSSITLMHVDNITFVEPYPDDSIIVINTFDTDTEAAAYRLDYGAAGLRPTGLGATNGCVWVQDDADNDPASGSMLIQEAYGAGVPQGSYRWDLPIALTNVSTCTNLQFDLKVDSNSALDQYGNAAYFQFAVRDQGFNYVGLEAGNVRIQPGNRGWQHISISNGGKPLTQLAAFTSLKAIQLDPYDGNYTNVQDVNNLTLMYIDNILFRKPPETTLSVPQPKMTAESVAQGLNLFAGSTGQYDRQNIRTLNNTDTGGNYWSWVGNGASPVSYSYTIAQYPGGSAAGFQSHIFFTPGEPTENAPDYNEANIVMLDLQVQGNGSASWSFRYKTNSVNSNNMLYNQGGFTNGVPGSVVDPHGPLGTWKITFVNDTNVTMTSPTGITSTFVLDPAIVANFADPISIFWGIQPNNSAGVGLKAVISDIKVAGIKANASDFEDNFAADYTPHGFNPNNVLDTDGNWLISAVFAPGVIGLQPSISPLWVNWTLPSTGFALQTNSILGNPSQFPWSTNGLPGPTLIGGVQRTLLSTNDIPANRGFFRLANPGY